MAYSSVPTVATGDLWTAANNNTYIRDNFAVGVPDIIVAKGDLVGGLAADSAQRIPVGANYNVLQADSSIGVGLGWNGTGLGAIYHRSTTISYTDNIEAQVTGFNTVDWDTNSFCSGDTLTIPAGMQGLYMVGAYAYWDSSGTANRLRQIGLLAGASAFAYHSTVCDTTHAIHCNICVAKNFGATTVITMNAVQNSGGALNINLPTMWLLKIR